MMLTSLHESQENPLITVQLNSENISVVICFTFSVLLRSSLGHLQKVFTANVPWQGTGKLQLAKYRNHDGKLQADAESPTLWFTHFPCVRLVVRQRHTQERTRAHHLFIRIYKLFRWHTYWHIICLNYSSSERVKVCGDGVCLTTRQTFKGKMFNLLHGAEFDFLAAGLQMWIKFCHINFVR